MLQVLLLCKYFIYVSEKICCFRTVSSPLHCYHWFCPSWSPWTPPCVSQCFFLSVGEVWCSVTSVFLAVFHVKHFKKIPHLFFPGIPLSALVFLFPSALTGRPSLLQTNTNVSFLISFLQKMNNTNHEPARRVSPGTKPIKPN